MKLLLMAVLGARLIVVPYIGAPQGTPAAPAGPLAAFEPLAGRTWLANGEL